MNCSVVKVSSSYKVDWIFSILNTPKESQTNEIQRDSFQNHFVLVALSNANFIFS